MQNPVLSVVPSEGYVVEISGRCNWVYDSFTAAVKAGLELKHKNSDAQVKVYDAKERSWSSASAKSQ